MEDEVLMEKDGINYKELAVYDKERKGIFIHKDQLNNDCFQVGDRSSINWKGTNAFLTLSTNL